VVGRVLSKNNRVHARTYYFPSNSNTFKNMQRQHSVRSLSSSSSGKIKSIGTHDGRFHCDEVLACFMLRLLPEYELAQIIRTRDEEILRTCDIVVDVGAVFDPNTLRFDHHQKSFNDTMNSLRPDKPWTTRLSSAGLIYAHYGEEVLAQILEKKKDDEAIQQLYDKVYENFIEEIDAVDNGISQNDYPKRYRVSTTLSDRVGFLNPTWRDVNPDETESFQKASELVGKEFLDRVHHYASDWDSYALVKAAVDARFDVDPSGEIVELNIGCPWREHLARLENELQVETPIKFIIFPDGKGKWRVQAVPISPDSFQLRTPLHEDWRGLRGKDLEDLSGIPTIDFVHMNGFIGGAAERDSVIQMAKLTLRKA